MGLGRNGDDRFDRRLFTLKLMMSTDGSDELFMRAQMLT